MSGEPLESAAVPALLCAGGGGREEEAGAAARTRRWLIFTRSWQPGSGASAASS